MNRLHQFEQLAKHAWYGPKVKALRPEQRQRIVDFIEKNAALGKSQFAQAAQMLPGNDKFALLMSELLMVSNQEEK